MEHLLTFDHDQVQRCVRIGSHTRAFRGPPRPMEIKRSIYRDRECRV